jgi:hypothetical protein
MEVYFKRIKYPSSIRTISHREKERNGFVKPQGKVAPRRMKEEETSL